MDETVDLLRVALERLAGRIGGDPDGGGLVDHDRLARSEGRLAELVDRLDLSPVEVDLLVVAASVQLDEGFSPASAPESPHRDRSNLSVGRAFDVVGLSLLDPEARLLVAPTGRLCRHRLLRVGEAGTGALPRRPLLVPERVVQHLLGSDVPDLAVAVATIPLIPAPSAGAAVVATAMAGGVRLVHLREGPRASGRAMAASAAAIAGRAPIGIDLARVRAEAVDATIDAAILEGVLAEGVVVLGPADRDVIDATRLEELADAPCPVILHGPDPLPGAGPVHHQLRLVVDDIDADGRLEVWRAALERAGLDAPDDLEIVAPVPLPPERALHAAYIAHSRSIGEQRPVTAADLLDAARSQSDGRLEALARLVRPAVDFGDLVMTEVVETELRRIVDRIRHQHTVRVEWGLGRVAARTPGVTALFAGPSGTGKTLSAEALAGELGVELYVVDLSTVVDKYVGETEKNLERVFTAAEAHSGVLFFDEADALFGKRSEVRGAHDRFANIEVAYLLQRIECFDGIAVLASNLRANLDDAFLRRLDVIISYDEPDEAGRLALWERHLPPAVPRAAGVDLPLLAAAVPLTGGLIRNICLDAAYCAAADGGALTMGHLVRSTARMQRMAGRLLDPAAFGPWAGELTGGGATAPGPPRP